MRHAIMVIGSGKNAEVLQKTIKHLDDEKIDFYIHWDKKFKRPVLKSNYSKIFFIDSRKVRWGSGTLVLVERDLLKSVYNSKYNYDYVHLISSSDIPLMTKEFFKTFFTKNLYLGFAPERKDTVERVKYYYPTDFINAKSILGKIIIKMSKIVNKVLKINRLNDKNIVINKGCQWFSIKENYVKKILQFDHIEMFKNTFASDELYLQTVLDKYKVGISEDDCGMAARYIDWKRGQPYVFTTDDINELRKVVNTKYAFARKVFDPSLLGKIFETK